MSFPHFDGSISSVKDGKTKFRSILLLWSLKFYDKKYFSLGVEKQCLNKVSFENILSAYMFSPDAALPPSSETQGQSVGSGKRRDESFQVGAKEPLGTHSHRTISKHSNWRRLLIGHKKWFVLLCPIGEQSLLSSFREFVHDYYCRDHGLSGSCIKEMHAVRKLSVWCKIPIWFRNTVCPKTKDALPNIQVWAYQRYSRLHRSRLGAIRKF